MFLHSHQEIAAARVKRKPKPGSSTTAIGGLKKAISAASRGYMTAVAAIMLADSSGRRVTASFCRLARTTVVAVDEYAPPSSAERSAPPFTGRERLTRDVK